MALDNLVRNWYRWHTSQPPIGPDIAANFRPLLCCCKGTGSTQWLLHGPAIPCAASCVSRRLVQMAPLSSVSYRRCTSGLTVPLLRCWPSWSTKPSLFRQYNFNWVPRIGVPCPTSSGIGASISAKKLPAFQEAHRLLPVKGKYRFRDEALWHS